MSDSKQESESLKSLITDTAISLAKAIDDNIEVTIVVSRRGPSQLLSDDLVVVAIAHSHSTTAAYEIGSVLEEAVAMQDDQDAADVASKAG